MKRLLLCTIVLAGLAAGAALALPAAPGQCAALATSTATVLAGDAGVQLEETTLPWLGPAAEATPMACSGQNCGCDAELQTCRASCFEDPPAEQPACLLQCTHEYKACALACCSP